MFYCKCGNEHIRDFLITKTVQGYVKKSECCFSILTFRYFFFPLSLYKIKKNHTYSKKNQDTLKHPILWQHGAAGKNIQRSICHANWRERYGYRYLYVKSAFFMNEPWSITVIWRIPATPITSNSGTPVDLPKCRLIYCKANCRVAHDTTNTREGGGFESWSRPGPPKE